MLWAKGLEVWRLQFRSCGRYGRYPNLSINQSKILSIYPYPSTCWSHIEWLLPKRVSWLHGFTPNCGAGWKWSFGTSRVLCWGTLHAAVTRCDKIANRFCCQTSECLLGNAVEYCCHVQRCALGYSSFRKFQTNPLWKVSQRLVTVVIVKHFIGRIETAQKRYLLTLPNSGWDMSGYEFPLKIGCSPI